MTAHVRRVETLLSPAGLWDTVLPVRRLARPGRTTGRPVQAKADKGVVATACLFRSATIVAETAAIARER